MNLVNGFPISVNKEDPIGKWHGTRKIQIKKGK